MAPCTPLVSPCDPHGNQPHQGAGHQHHQRQQDLVPVLPQHLHAQVVLRAWQCSTGVETTTGYGNPQACQHHIDGVCRSSCKRGSAARGWKQQQGMGTRKHASTTLMRCAGHPASTAVQHRAEAQVGCSVSKAASSK
eukprot:1047864-Pelagomonas_calceolata.AAC.4